jgi:predicted TIM-barrel fold metal-dependent hydrolase
MAIIDCHNHVGSSNWIFGQSVADLIGSIAQAGIDKAVAFTYPQNIDNEEIARAQAAHPDRIIGFGVVNPWSHRLRRELEDCRELGLGGIKLHPFLHGYAIDSAELTRPIFEFCHDVGWPIVVHTFSDGPYNTPYQVEEMARRFPQVTIIMLHSGFMWMTEQAVLAASRCHNLLLETSCVDAGEVRNFIDRLGAERVAMGTDSPTGWHRHELEKIRLVSRTEEEYRLVAGGNLERVLGLT